MLLITMAALLFGLMKSLGAPAAVFAIVTVLFVGVATGQVLLFGGQRPREASVLVGACLFPVEILALLVYVWVSPLAGVGFSPLGLPCLAVTGAILGYLAGTLTAGIFFVRQRYSEDSEDSDEPRLQLQPLSEADIATLIEWTKSRTLFDCWAGTTFSYPLDRQQILDRLGNAEGEQPRRRMFMAVCPTAQRPVGYIELDRIDPRTHSACVGLALIASGESDRRRLCVALLSAMIEVAFTKIQLHRVYTVVLSQDSITRACYREIGFEEEKVLSEGPSVDGRRQSVVRLRIVDPRRMRQSYSQPEAPYSG